ncbi:DUF2812 domain-containing protein [Candidatus Contubernalis alkaliaceticus]|uniref:DUF2812 domain-containing protein n=1 Tax=Candidatus Contubernalis alkaliaceticus TaxID=338645 RepID=UPI001F4C39ED|nr:DUF2812 domain-containing protein [Candidatus Contubernalis alkalaceticus]UNC91546.1 DUF2812 domain-containing protein [Candidatus Contubernalis alkalaceticus]
MTKKVFRPFWSYDVQETEEWLSSMAAKGYYLQKFTKTSFFVFTKGEPKCITYFINYEKTPREALPSAMQNDGWARVFGRGKWQVFSNKKPKEEIRTNPLRDNLLTTRNGTIMYIFGYFAVTNFVLFFVSIYIQLLFSNQPVTIEPSPMWSVTLIFYTWVYYSFIKLYRANKKLGQEPHISDTYTYSPEEKLTLHGKAFKKIKLGWMYAPDKLEKWLEQMEGQGYNLLRIGWSGTAYYFIKGKPRRVKYCTDFQNKADESYFDIHSDAGWKLLFTRGSFFERWSIWSREYAEGQEEPQLYSSNSDLLQSARRIAFTYSLLFFPLVFIYGIAIWQHIYSVLNYGAPFQFSMLLFGISIIIFGSLIMQAWLYYRRLKNRFMKNAN